MANQACSLHAGIGLGRDAINEKFIEAVRELETPRYALAQGRFS